MFVLLKFLTTLSDIYALIFFFSEIVCSSDEIVVYENRLISNQTSYNLGESVLLQCIEGYNNAGTQLQFCLENELWTLAKPLCTGKKSLM